MDAIKGINVLMYVNDPTEGEIFFACSRNCEFTPQLSLQEVTNYASNLFREYEPDLGSWGMLIDGLVIVDGYSYSKIIRDQKAQRKIQVYFSVDQGVDGYVVYSGYGFITSVTISAPYDGVATYAATIQGTGAYDVTNTTPPPPTPNPVFRYQFPAAAGGELFILASELIGMTLVGCFRGGPEVMTILTSGTPLGNEVRFTSALGRIDFASDNPLFPGELITVQYK